MEKNMQSYRLSDLVKIKNGKDHKMLSNGKNPVLGSGGIMRYVDKFLYDKPSVLLPRKGTLDNIQYCDVPFWTVDTLYYTEVNTNLANPYYLYRYLSLLDLSILDSGTGVPSMTFDNYYGLKIFLPNIEKQTIIAQILQTLDKKITINRAINQNLEAMAKQLYDYWFVQFDFPNEEGKPYKSSGGEMVWNEKLKRKIPKGWDNCTLEYFLAIKNGRDHKHLAEGVYPVYGSGGEMRRVNENLYRGESVLMPRKGTLNNIMYVDEAFWTVDTMFYSEMKVPYCAKYIFFAIKDIDFTRWNSGTGVPSMTASTLYNLPMIKPHKDLLKKFDKTITPIFYKMKQIRVECEELTKQRDELLPLLINGQVSVNSDLSHTNLFTTSSRVLFPHPPHPSSAQLPILYWRFGYPHQHSSKLQ
ncbi:restriction endonuclease subunit S [Bacteroides uniformis]|uniref:restriction endonuclease subunit S n=1 Tax=Bacteroides uniformis TaxID=820 RepID=UPI00232D4979|nr:restriction endonuclease subunit S [Bacteroides uniformis]MDC1819699.1 restriction endonuclease subunit S [Bacteroides uniformis]